MRIPFLRVLSLTLLLGTVGADTLKVATYNLRNYLATDRWVEGRYLSDLPKPEIEKAALREVLRSVAPDIVILQEMGEGAHLTELQLDLKNEGLDYPYQYLAEGSDQDRHLALLSRIKPLELKTHKDLEFDYFGETIPVKRGMLEAIFEVGEQRWKIYGLHLKSKWSDNKEDPSSDSRRRAETLACRKRILQQSKQDGLSYIIMGDLNDSKRNAPVRLFLKRGGETLTTMLDCNDERGHRWTHYYEQQDEYRRVDYILMQTDFPAAVVEDRGYIFDGPNALIASDHRLVWMELNFGINP